MSRTIKGSKGAGYEFWSRRFPKYFLDPSPFNKRLTHRYERREGKVAAIMEDHQEVNEPIRLGQCIRCDKTVYSLAGITGQPDDAMEVVATGHYGSKHDLQRFTTYLCDDCADKVGFATE